MESKKKFNVKHFTLIALCLVACFTLCLFAVFASDSGVGETASATNYFAFYVPTYNYDDFRFNSSTNYVSSSDYALIPFSEGLNYHGILGNRTDMSELGSLFIAPDNTSFFFYDIDYTSLSSYYSSLPFGVSINNPYNFRLRIGSFNSSSNSSVTCVVTPFYSNDGVNWYYYNSSNFTSYSYTYGNTRVSTVSLTLGSISGYRYYRFVVYPSTQVAYNVYFYYCLVTLNDFAYNEFVTYSDYQAGVIGGGSSDDPSSDDPSIPLNAEWYGFTKSNLLPNNGRLCYAPVDSTALSADTAVTSVPKKVWYTTSTSGVTYSSRSDSTPLNTVLGMTISPSSSYTMYLDYGNAYGEYYTFSLFYDIIVDASDHTHSVTLDYVPFTLKFGVYDPATSSYVSSYTSSDLLLDDTGYHWLTVSSDAPLSTLGTDYYIRLEATFSNTTSNSLYFGFDNMKFEDASFFTGYIGRTDAIVNSTINENIISNYKFNELIGRDPVSPVANKWSLYTNSHTVYSNSVSHLTDIGWYFESASGDDYSVIYYVPYDAYHHTDDPTHFTFTLNYTSDTLMYFIVRDQNTNEALQASLLPATLGRLDQFSIGFSRSSAVEGFFLEIIASDGGKIACYLGKLETGYTFTGFTFGYQEIKSQYDAGYANGYSAAMDSVASYSALVDFSDALEGYRIDRGYEDIFGITQSDLADLTGTFSSFFYDAIDANFAIQGFELVYDVNQVPSGFILYGSRFATIEDLEHPPVNDGNPYIKLQFYDDTSYFWIGDPEKPTPFEPSLYPDYCKFYVTLYQGVYQSILVNNDASYQLGHVAGYADGYVDGQSNGLAKGFNDAMELGGTGSWRSFFMAFIDVPVKVLTSMFDFDFFGFNLFSLIKVFASIAIILLLFRFLLKGKVKA